MIIDSCNAWVRKKKKKICEFSMRFEWLLIYILNFCSKNTDFREFHNYIISSTYIFPFRI